MSQHEIEKLVLDCLYLSVLTMTDFLQSVARYVNICKKELDTLSYHSDCFNMIWWIWHVQPAVQVASMLLFEVDSVQHVIDKLAEVRVLLELPVQRPAAGAATVDGPNELL